MRLIPMDFVREDHVLAKTIYDDQNRVLLMRGIRLKSSLVSKLKEMGYHSIYINDEYSTDYIEDIIKPQLRQKAMVTLKSILSTTSLWTDENKKKAEVRMLKDKTYKDMAALKDVTKEIVDELVISKDVMVSLVDLKSRNSFLFSHSVNVAILSLVLGVSMGLNKNELNDLALGALLHDVGMISVPQEIVDKGLNLNESEWSIYRQHTRKGYEYLGQLVNMDAHVKIIALEHHEQMDGKGYPLGLRDVQIHKLSKIVAVTDAYDLLTSSNPMVSPSEALEYIMGNCGSKFDLEIVKNFLKKIVPYPIGMIVKLSSGDVCIVTAINADFPLRPVLKVIKGSKQNQEINLVHEQGITISGIQYLV
ncbi:MAG: HD-GYP domain-containing protein [Bacillota bacterium]